MHYVSLGIFIANAVYTNMEVIVVAKHHLFLPCKRKISFTLPLSSVTNDQKSGCCESQQRRHWNIGGDLRIQAVLDKSIDFGRKEWEFAVSHSFDEDVIRAKYSTGTKDLGVEFSWKDLMTKEGRIKILASWNLAEGIGRPKSSLFRVLGILACNWCIVVRLLSC